jgi:flagellar protein FlaG
MSIRPIETPFAPSPPKPATRQNGDTQTAPVAVAQRGGSVVADNTNTTGGTGTIATANAARNNPASAVEQDRPGDSRRELLAAVERAQRIIEPQVRDMSFSIHEKSGQIVVRIIDRESQEVIRQIPGEDMLRIAENIEAMQGRNLPGLLLKQEV